VGIDINMSSKQNKSCGGWLKENKDVTRRKIEGRKEEQDKERYEKGRSQFTVFNVACRTVII
jgi:hypothetical protein